MEYISVVCLVFFLLSIIIGLLNFHFIVFGIIGIFKCKKFPKTEIKKKYGILIPARNEEKVIGNLIESIRKTNYPQDKLEIFVIAHNCTDCTAKICRDISKKYQGIHVYEYTNEQEKTKGYALKYLLEQIKEEFGINCCDGYFVFDADNIITSNYFDKMNDAFVAGGDSCVVTSFRNSKNFGSNLMSGSYGLHFVQLCRFESRGRAVCGVSTRILGTGFVFSWDLVKDGWKYVTLTEDTEFAADLVLKGNRILYCDEAVFYDEQPTTFKMMYRQRLRWAKGGLLVCGTRFKDLVRGLFKKDLKINSKAKKFSIYDNLMCVIPIGMISATLFVINVICVLVGLAFGGSITNIVLYWFIGLLIGAIIGYAVMVIFGIFIFIIEENRIKNVNSWKKVGVVFVWPIWYFLGILFQFIALFSKNLGWKAIAHNDTTNIEKLNSKNHQTEEEKLEG